MSVQNREKEKEKYLIYLFVELWREPFPNTPQNEEDGFVGKGLDSYKEKGTILSLEWYIDSEWNHNERETLILCFVHLKWSDSQRKGEEQIGV